MRVRDEIQQPCRDGIPQVLQVAFPTISRRGDLIDSEM